MTAFKLYKNMLLYSLGRLMDIRPPWQGPDFKPKDLIKTSLVSITDQNPNDPLRPT